MRFGICLALLSIIIFYKGSFIFAEENSIDLQIELMPWEQVNELLPKHTKFTVLDVETGKKFEVQRRAGSQHADVQPLTSNDTKIMKEIYDDEWSWKRRAIIVIHDDHWIAASMHGMPHGAGKLNNNFPGHFCIHFFGSKTHRSNFMDLSHKIMTLKAAGKLTAYVGKSDPYELAEIFIASVKQQDSWILSLISLQDLDWKEKTSSIENIKLTSISTDKKEELTDDLGFTIPVEIEWFDKETGKNVFQGDINLFRSYPSDSWKVDGQRFLEDLFESEDSHEETSKVPHD